MAASAGTSLVSAEGKYPSTPHLPFSPGVNSDDKVGSGCHDFLKVPIVVTEKLDGGNCCIVDGKVYARTHSKEATHASFSPIKQLAQTLKFSGQVPAGTKLFGENMFGVHSIEYDGLESAFYLFGVQYPDGRYGSWDEVVALAEATELPTVPTVFQGEVKTATELQDLIEQRAAQPSLVSSSTVLPEGFVVRTADGFKHQQFERRVIKYVRANHVQTDDTWLRTWKKASISQSKTPEGGAPSDASLSASSSEHFGEEQSDTRQETRVVASNKAQAAKADERVHKTSYVITQVRGLSAASSAQIRLKQGNLSLNSAFNSVKNGIVVYNRRFDFVTVQRPSSVVVAVDKGKSLGRTAEIAIGTITVPETCFTGLPLRQWVDLEGPEGDAAACQVQIEIIGRHEMGQRWRMAHHLTYSDIVGLVCIRLNNLRLTPTSQQKLGKHRLVVAVEAFGMHFRGAAMPGKGAGSIALTQNCRGWITDVDLGHSVRFFLGAEGKKHFFAAGTAVLRDLLSSGDHTIQLVDIKDQTLRTDAQVSSFVVMAPGLTPRPGAEEEEGGGTALLAAAEAQGRGEPAEPIAVQPAGIASIDMHVDLKAKEQAQAWFVRGLLEQFDTDGDGKFSVPELACMMSVLKAGSDRDAVDATTYEKEATELMARVDSSQDNLLDSDELIAFLMSHDFQHSPFGYSIVNFLADGVEGRLAMMDLYPIAKQAGETSGGADIISVQSGMGGAAADVDGLAVWDDATGLIVREHIPRFVKMALDMAYKGVLSTGALARTGAMRSILRKLTAHEGAHMSSADSRSMIQPFIAAHGLNVDEIEQPVGSFTCFNDFFTRKLREGARPIAAPEDDGVAVSPADCRLLVFPSIQEATSIWIKGASFTVDSLLGPDMAQFADRFGGGSLVIARLAPQDYHRWHFPVSGQYGTPVPVPGELFTVNPIAVRRNIDVYTRNQRQVCMVETEAFGTVAMVAVGATMVGSINLTATPGRAVRKGQEHGYFAFGGSTVVLLFQPGRIRFEGDLLARSALPLETLVKMGRRIGVPAGRQQAGAAAPATHEAAVPPPAAATGAAVEQSTESK